MPHIEIDKPPLIFDHPKYCNGLHRSHCRFLEDGSTWCILFLNENSVTKGAPALVKKCDECIEEWKKASEKQTSRLVGMAMKIVRSKIKKLRGKS